MDNQALNSKPVFFEKGKQAFLFIHGFTSTPSSLMPVAEKCAEKGWTVSMPLLPGHGLTPIDMMKTSGQDWMDAALAAYDTLALRYERPAVAGLSMGAALALHIAANRPVSAVTALAPALYIKDWRVNLVPIMKLFNPWQKAISNDMKFSIYREEAYSKYHLKNLQDLMVVMKTVRQELKNITAPLLTIQSDQDHVVPPACMDDLVKWAGSKIITKHRLHNSYHVITLDQEFELVAKLMNDFFHQHC